MGFRLIKLFELFYRNTTPILTKSGFQNVIPNQPTAALIVIGDEIINGHIIDTNSQFICKGLHDLGIKICRISVLPDDVNKVAKEIRIFSKRYTYVLTSGGIGPTHDDVTYEAVAKAFNESLFLHPEIMQIVRDLYKTPEAIAAGQKLAMVPKSSKLIFGYDKNTGLRSRFPNVSVNNIYIFPGIPHFCRYLFSLVAHLQFSGSSIKYFLKSMYLDTTEVNIVKTLNKFVLQYPNVNFGSYPEIDHSYYKVKITLESESEPYLKLAYETLKFELEDHIVSFDPEPLVNADKKIKKIIENSNCNKLKVGYDRVKKINFSKTAVWFNGDVQSTLILHLCHGAMLGFAPNCRTKIETIYYEDETYTKEQQKFLTDILQRYNLRLHTVNITNEESLKCIANNTLLLVSEAAKAEINTKLECKMENPIEDWSIEETIEFIRCLSLPYICPNDCQK